MLRPLIWPFLALISIAFLTSCSNYSHLPRADDALPRQTVAERDAERASVARQAEQQRRDQLEAIGSTLPPEAAADPAISTCFPFLQYEDLSLGDVSEAFEALRIEFGLSDAEMFTEHRRVLRQVMTEFAYCMERSDRDGAAIETERRARSQFPLRPRGPEDGESIDIDLQFARVFVNEGEHAAVREKALSSLFIDQLIRNFRPARRRWGVSTYSSSGVRRNDEDRIAELELIGPRAESSVELRGQVAVITARVFRADHESTSALLHGWSSHVASLARADRILLDLRSASGKDTAVVDQLFEAIRSSGVPVVAWTDPLTREGAEVLLYRLRRAGHAVWILGASTRGYFFDECDVAIPQTTYKMWMNCRVGVDEIASLRADLLLDRGQTSEFSVTEMERLYALGLSYLRPHVESRRVASRILRERRGTQTGQGARSGRRRPPRSNSPGGPITRGNDTGSVRNPRPVGNRIPPQHATVLQPIADQLGSGHLTLDRVIELAALFPTERDVARTDFGTVRRREGEPAASSRPRSDQRESDSDDSNPGGETPSPAPPVPVDGSDGNDGSGETAPEEPTSPEQPPAPVPPSQPGTGEDSDSESEGEGSSSNEDDGFWI